MPLMDITDPRSAGEHIIGMHNAPDENDEHIPLALKDSKWVGVDEQNPTNYKPQMTTSLDEIIEEEVFTFYADENTGGASSYEAFPQMFVFNSAPIYLLHCKDKYADDLPKANLKSSESPNPRKRNLSVVQENPSEEEIYSEEWVTDMILGEESDTCTEESVAGPSNSGLPNDEKKTFPWNNYFADSDTDSESEIYAIMAAKMPVEVHSATSLRDIIADVSTRTNFMERGRKSLVHDTDNHYNFFESNKQGGEVGTEVHNTTDLQDMLFQSEEMDTVDENRKSLVHSTTSLHDIITHVNEQTNTVEESRKSLVHSTTSFHDIINANVEGNTPEERRKSVHNTSDYLGLLKKGKGKKEKNKSQDKS